MPLYGSRRQPIGAEQAAHSNGECERDEEGGNCKQKWTASHHTKQYSPRAHARTHTHTNLLAGLKQKRGATIQQSKATHANFTQHFRGTGCMLQRRIGVVFLGGKWRGVGSRFLCRGEERRGEEDVDREERRGRCRQRGEETRGEERKM